MYSDDELTAALRRAFEAETRTVYPPPRQRDAIARALERPRRHLADGRPRATHGRFLVAAVAVVAVAVLAVVIVAGGSTSRPGPPGMLRPSVVSPPAARLVGCGNIIDATRDVTLPGAQIVLTDVAMPPRYLSDPVRLRRGRLRWWRKAGLLVWAGAGPVTLAVPAAWRSRAAITWGNGLPRAKVVRIARCGSPPDRWHVYVGGFFTRARATCLPLTVHIGSATRTLRFGIGRRCGSR